MQISYKKKLELNKGIVLVPVFDDLKNLPDYIQGWLKDRIKEGSFKTEYGDLIWNYNSDPKVPDLTFVVALGDKKAITPALIRKAYAKAVKQIRTKDLHELNVYLPTSMHAYLQEISEGIALANYRLGIYKTGKDRQEEMDKIIKKVTFIGELDKAKKQLLDKGTLIGEKVNEVRDLVNGPHNYININYFTELSKKIARKNKYKVRILERRQMEKLGMGALLGVNLGSEIGAKMVLLEYMPNGRNEKPIALVGKGVTFDTGGLNLKSGNGIDWMKMDMAGASVVLGVFMLLQSLGIKKNVVAAIPLTDNAIDAKAQKPNDIVTTYAGKTVEVANTDAEGRLILIDAISYTIKQYKPEAIIDLATLTGACMIALGFEYAGMFGNDNELKAAVAKAASETDEEVWELPIHEDHSKQIKGVFSDLKNLGAGRYAGASTAAAFIREFVEDTKWIHLDIAGVSKSDRPKDCELEGSASGYGVRLLIRLLENLAA